MSYTQFASTAKCALDAKTPEEAINLFVNWVVSHPDEYPDDITGYTRDDLFAEVEPYIMMEKESQAIVSLDTEGDGNYNSEVFKCITNYFATIQTSDYMTTEWTCYDSRDGLSSGTDYYDKNGKWFDMADKSKDSEALDIIARTLSGSEWTADMFDAIADLVRATGREIQDA
jgi:hypothetical protein